MLVIIIIDKKFCTVIIDYYFFYLIMERCDKPYAVVRFDNNTYSEIPVLWLSDDKLSCWWPKCQNPCSLMLKNILPNSNKIEWSKFNVVVECFTATLDSARKKAEHSDYTSADDDFMAKGRGKRKKRPKVISDSDSSEYDDPDQPPSIVALYKDKIEKVLDKKTIPNGSSSPNTAERLNNNYGLITCDESSSTVTVSSVSSGSSISMDYTKLDDILQSVNTVKIYVKSIDNRLQVLEGKQKSADIENNTTLQKLLPLNNLEELNGFENLLCEDEMIQNQYRTFLNLIGGRDAKDNLQRILKKSFSNELACKCSWLGLRSNIKVCDLNIMKSIKTYILSHFADFRENNFEKVASEWFRLSKLRLSREKKLREGDGSN